MAHVRIYTTPACPYCWRAKRLLHGRGVPFEEIDVSGDGALRAWLVQATGQRTVPQIFIDGRSRCGYTELVALDVGGELDRLLGHVPV